jgi:regulator of sirC expression with transglutaminase-like and TPR domain
MFRIFTLLTGFLFLSNAATAQIRYTGQTIQDILNQPENEIDLGLAVLVLAKEAYPSINVNRFLDILDYQARQIDYLLQGVEDSEARIGMMNTYLYKPGWWNDSLTFTYDINDLEAKAKENQFLNGLISTRRGSCVTLPMLWMVLADRLGWPVHAVLSTKHYFLRYEDDRLEQKNIDATIWGSYASDEQYRIDGRIPDHAIENGVFLRSLTRKEYLAALLVNQMRHYHEREQDLVKAIEYLELAISINDSHSPAWWNAGVLYLEQARNLQKEWENEMQKANDSVMAELVTASIRSEQAKTLPRPENRTTQSDSFIQVQELEFTLTTTSGNPSFDIRPMTQNRVGMVIDNELAAEFNEQIEAIAQQLEQKYAPIIMENLTKSRQYRQRATELGISFGFTDEFLLKQQRSVELQSINENQKRP